MGVCISMCMGMFMETYLCMVWACLWRRIYAWYGHAYAFRGKYTDMCICICMCMCMGIVMCMCMGIVMCMCMGMGVCMGMRKVSAETQATGRSRTWKLGMQVGSIQASLTATQVGGHLLTNTTFDGQHHPRLILVLAQSGVGRK